MLMFWVGLIATTTAAQEVATPGTALSFDEAAARLAGVSDALAAADAHVRGQQDLFDATRSLRLPRLTLEARWLEFQKTLDLPVGSLAPVAAEFGLPDPLHFQKRESRFRPVLTTVLPLYTAGQIPAARSAAGAAVEEAQAGRDAAGQSQILLLAQSYFAQQLAAQALRVRLDVRSGLEQHLGDTEKLEGEGLATKAQRLQATVARDRADREYQRALSTYETVTAALARLLRSDAPVSTSTQLFVIGEPLETLAAFQRSAVERHPGLARLRAVSEQASQGVRAQQAELRPQVFLFGSYDLDRHDELLSDPDWALGVGVRYALVSGTDRARHVSAARETEAQASLSSREAENEVMIGVIRAWNDLDSARRQFLLLDSSIEQTEENVRLQQLSFREGQSTSLDVIDAQLALGGALVERAEAAYDYDVALARLLDVSGQLERYPEYLAKANRVIGP
jgi:outer membrane protein TolC